MSLPGRDPDEAIRIGERAGDRDATRWGSLLVIFMRLVAALWTVQGLAQWQVMLVGEDVLFDHVSTAVGVAVIVFAVADLLAAIGLWLAAPWGGVLWILVVFAQAVVAIALPDFFEGGRLVLALDLLLVGLYLLLTFKASMQGVDNYAGPRRSRRSLLSRLRRRA